MPENQRLLVNRELRQVFWNGKLLFQGVIKGEIFLALYERRGRLVRYEQLYEYVWGLDTENAANVIKVHLSRMRRLLRESTGSSVMITTRHGLGLILEIKAEP